MNVLFLFVAVSVEVDFLFFLDVFGPSSLSESNEVQSGYSTLMRNNFSFLNLGLVPSSLGFAIILCC